jgi:hypothetical protein
MIPIVPIIGAAAGLAGILQGVSQNSRAKRMYGDAMNAHKAIPLNDPAQLSYLDDVRMHRRALEAGTSKMMGLRTRIAQNGLAQTQANAARNAGGSAGTLMDILLRSQQQFGNTLNEGAAQEQHDRREEIEPQEKFDTVHSDKIGFVLEKIREYPNIGERHESGVKTIGELLRVSSQNPDSKDRIEYQYAKDNEIAHASLMKLTVISLHST